MFSLASHDSRDGMGYFELDMAVRDGNMFLCVCLLFLGFKRIFSWVGITMYVGLVCCLHVYFSSSFLHHGSLFCSFMTSFFGFRSGLETRSEVGYLDEVGVEDGDTIGSRTRLFVFSLLE
ncbi:hypothetical protein B0T16DRAFT_409069 [Cercophora newfieldiana]|uniref:Transmembrane protein n=1 Tax=Cercophora newfieldiana TaxID=92897 RepID=A0AA40CRN7_9PEZI|nr:hypothetical protein B0T16DRAFT_409069 [Cercophora newfieldiana]